MRIRYKIASGYLVAALLTIIMAGASYWSMSRIRASHVDLAKHIAPEIENLHAIRFAGIRLVASSVESAFLAGSAGSGSSQRMEEEYVKDAAAVLAAELGRLQRMLELRADHHHLAGLPTMKKAASRLVADAARFRDAAMRGAPAAEVGELKERFEEAENEFLALIDSALREEQSDYRKGDLSSEAAFSTALTTITISGGCFFFVALVGGNLLAGSIARPLQQLREGVEKAEQGEWTAVAVDSSTTEIEGVAAAFNRMVEKRRDAEKMLHHKAEELRENNDELQAFAYVTAHDLQEPLLNVGVYAGELRVIAGNLEEELDPVLSALDPGAQARVRQMLHEEVPEAVSYIGAGVTLMKERVSAVGKLACLRDHELRLRPVAVSRIVERVLSEMRQRLEASGARVVVGELPEATGDDQLLAEVFRQLLDNALKYREPLRAAVVEIGSSTGEGDTTVYHVRDNGIGIAEENHHRIFHLFRSGGPSWGHGVGLAYVRSILRRHGGRIWCESRPGEGATFFFSLPGSLPVGMEA